MLRLGSFLVLYYILALFCKQAGLRCRYSAAWYRVGFVLAVVSLVFLFEVLVLFLLGKLSYLLASTIS